MVYSSNTSHLLGLCMYSFTREFTPLFYSISVSLLCALAVKGDRFIPVLKSKDEFKYGPINQFSCWLNKEFGKNSWLYHSI